MQHLPEIIILNNDFNILRFESLKIKHYRKQNRTFYNYNFKHRTLEQRIITLNIWKLEHRASSIEHRKQFTSEQFSVANIFAMEQSATVSGCFPSKAEAALRTKARDATNLIWQKEKNNNFNQIYPRKTFCLCDFEGLNLL